MTLEEILGLCAGHFAFFDLIDDGQFKGEEVITLSTLGDWIHHFYPEEG